jgi:hypothetical protein
MLQRIQTEVNDVRRVLMIENRKNAAFIVKLVEHGKAVRQKCSG